MRQAPYIIGYMIVRNELDIIKEVIDYYISFNIRIVAIDNGSSDGSLEYLAERVKDLRCVTHHPTGEYDLLSLIRLAVGITQSFEPSWILHIDADHFYDPPRRFDGFQDLVRAAEDEGAQCVLFDEYTFYHTGNDNPIITTTQDRMRYYAKHNGLPQPRLFKSIPGIDAYSGGGHYITIGGTPARAFSSRGTLRHYPFRSFEQGRRKLRERRGRYSIEGRRRGWHKQYDALAGDGWFVPNPSGLAFWTPNSELMSVSEIGCGEGAWQKIQ
jgi:hypothetical protein